MSKSDPRSTALVIESSLRAIPWLMCKACADQCAHDKPDYPAMVQPVLTLMSRARREAWESAATEVEFLASVITDEHFSAGLRRMAERWRAA